MKKKNIKENGFSMLELLATILIISIVLGVGSYFIFNVLSSSNDKVNTIAIDSLKKTSQIYAKEYPNEIIWHSIETSENSYTCISIDSLVNKGYLNKNEIEEFKKNSNYIVITRDSNNNVINEELDVKNEKCGSTVKWKVPIPTSGKYCLNPVYTGKELNLTNQADISGFSFGDNQPTATDAGSYQVTAKLNDGYVWYDDTTEDKTITCSIKKAKASLKIVSNSNSANPNGMNGEDGKALGTTELEIEGNTSGTLSLKSSSKDIATAKVIDGNGITAEVNKKVAIEKIATRNALTYITITLNPSDKKNYYSGSIVYTIGKVTKIPVKKPSSAKNCSNLRYNGNLQIITKDLMDGYTVSGNEQIKVGTYPITANLKYGYMWEDGSIEPVEFNCDILRPTVVVSYNSNGGTSCNSKTVVHLDPYGTLCTPQKTGYTFSSWKDSGKNVITSTSIVKNDKNHTLDANWNANTYTIVYHGNGATGGSTASSKHTYNVAKTLTKNGFVRTGYKFVGWAEENKKDTKKYNDQASVSNLTTKNNGTINLYAVWVPNVCTITFAPNSGSFQTNANNNVKKMNYGDATSGNAGMWNANDGTYSAVRTGYHINSSSAWKRTSDGVTFDETKNYTATDFCPNLGNDDQSVTLNANWNVNTYTVKYNGNGATSGSTANSSHTYDVAKTLTKNGFTKTGHKFVGWATSTNGSVTYNDQASVINLTTTNNGTVNLYAVWEAKKVTVTFIRNYNSTDNTSKTQTFTYGVSGQKFNSGFSRTGYNALGWSTDRNATSKTWNFTSDVSDNWINSNSPSITLYAVWSVKKVTVTFIRNYNSTDNTSKTQTFTYGASGQSFNSGFSRTGYTPLGWSTNRSATSQTYSFKSGVSDDWINSNSPSITLYAIWRINVCTITYNPNGGKFNSNSNDTVQKMNYGTSTSNMRNASGGTYDATRSGNYSHIRKSVAWISSYDKLKYNQDNGYNATDFCPNLANGDQSVTLYVNWFKWQKRTWNSCKTGSNTCKGGNVCTGGWVNDCMSGYNSSRQCKTIEGSDATWISGTKQCCRSVWKDCASSYWDSCKTGSNTCKGGWNSWTNVNSCSESSKVECKRVYVKDQ